MMIRKIYTALRLIPAIFLFQAVPLFGQTLQSSAKKGEKEINVTADSLTVRESGKEVEAKGNVEIRREEMTLKADEARMNRETQEVEAKGKVSVDDIQGSLKAEALRLNLEQETGTIEQGEIFFERGHLNIGGRRLEKFAGQAFHIDEGFFTTCLCESGPPTWKVVAKEIELEREGKGIIKGGTFYIMDIPVLYLPYGFFPVRSQRQTGFLFPKIGSASRDGFRFEQPFFWAISKSTDATFSVDVESRSRIGLLGELRTILSRQARGQINLSYFNETFRSTEQRERAIVDRTIAKPSIPKDRWSVFATHRHTATSDWKNYSDVAAFSDNLFTRELVDRLDLGFGQEADLRRSRYARSQFGLFRSRDDIQLQGEWAFSQDFIQPAKGTFQKTPQILFKGRQILGDTPLELRWRTEGVNYLRREGADGLRLDLRPQFILPFRLPPFLRGSFDLAPRETYYHLYQSEGFFSRNKSRELVEVGGKVGTSIARVFNIDGSYLKKMKHVLEPEVSYLFIPYRTQRDIPIMDGVDRINRRNLLTFSLNNRLWGKFFQEAIGLPGDQDVELVSSPTVGDIREMGRLRLALSYDIDRERKGGNTLSDLDANLKITPVDYLALGVDGGVKPGAWQVTQTGLVFSLLDPRPIARRVLDRDFMRPSQLDFRYNFTRRGPNGFLAEDANIVLDLPANCSSHPLDPRCPTRFAENVAAGMNWNLLFHLTDHLLFFFDSSYNVRDARFISNRGALKILSKCECWTLRLSLNRTTNPAKTTFRFDFSLLGLGSQNQELFR
jgi:LPS-assembly protein